MTIESSLSERADGQCELCGSKQELEVFEAARTGEASSPENCALLCDVCRNQINQSAETDPNHWRCLSGSVWSEYPVIQILSWHMLNNLRDEGWAPELLEQMYLDEETLAWAKEFHASHGGGGVEDVPATKDSNGSKLNEGDSVTLIKDLDVKGANFTAKRGTLVKNISLTDDPGLIEGKVNGTQIVLKTEFLKKV